MVVVVVVVVVYVCVCVCVPPYGVFTELERSQNAAYRRERSDDSLSRQ